MLHHIQMGGWAMWPVFAFGLVAVGAAGRFAWRGEHQLLGFIRWALWTVLATGGFGFAGGSIRLLGAAARAGDSTERATILVEGFGEAMNNPAGALMFTVVACALTAVGLRRHPLPNPSAIPK